MATKFVVAKYVPNVRRMEPRNIGVIVWSDGAVRARFLGENEHFPRHVGIKDKQAYRNWLELWRLQISKPHLECGNGETVDRNSPDYLDSLREWSRGNFLLVEGGDILERVKSAELDQLVEYLFHELVAIGESQERRERESETLRVVAHNLIKESGISAFSQFHQNEQQWFMSFGVTRYMKLDYSIGPVERPYSIFHRFILSHRQAFDATLLQISQFMASRDFSRDRCGALVLGKFDADDKVQKEHRDVLEHVATVIEVDNPYAAKQKVSAIASKNGSE